MLSLDSILDKISEGYKFEYSNDIQCIADAIRLNPKFGFTLSHLLGSVAKWAIIQHPYNNPPYLMRFLSKISDEFKNNQELDVSIPKFYYVVKHYNDVSKYLFDWFTKHREFSHWGLEDPQYYDSVDLYALCDNVTWDLYLSSRV